MSRKSGGIRADGATLKFHTSGFFCAWTGIDWSDRGARERIDITHGGSPRPGTGEFGGEESIPSGIQSAGSIALTLVYFPEETPPWGGDPEPVTLALELLAGQTVPTSYSGLAYLTNEGITFAIKDKVGQTATLVCTGVWRKTPAVRS